MDLTYIDGEGNSVAVVYKGASSDSLTHTIRLEYGSKLHIRNSNLQLIDQPDLSNFPKTPLEYRNEVETGLTLQEAQDLAQPHNLSPLQQELMSWHHNIYHLPFRIPFRLTSMGFLTNQLLECRNKPRLYVACQFGAAHCFPWHTKGNKSGSICRPEQINPGDGVSVDHIVSYQPDLISQMSGYLTSQNFWGCTTFVDHVSD